ncbi:hypothetical protein L1987_79524 [Smallanthus sonchifolius]|uniref:Uncharacterized protein n=1 Tax=Smallanthus sonchifolius TaxID=185202 RepID=A0ACB8ZGQ2_9ASTR|nr:hypothetical protein L1987_79524 [Smallanthus sonchifolius]
MKDDVYGRGNEGHTSARTYKAKDENCNLRSSTFNRLKGHRQFVVIDYRPQSEKMPRNKDETPAVRVYTVCDESKYLIVRNVPALGCGDELRKLFGGYGEIDEFVPLDDEDCEPFTDVYWIKFHHVHNARFAKRKLDESVFIGNRLQVSYAPQYESLNDTKEKLEGRRKEVIARLNPGRSKGSSVFRAASISTHKNFISGPLNIQQSDPREIHPQHSIHSQTFPSTVSSNQFLHVESMNQTVRLVREKLNKIESDADTLKVRSSKRPRNDNRRRI